MEPSPYWDANNCFANQDILLFYETAKDYRSLIHILNQINPFHILTSNVFKLNFNVMLHLYLGLTVASFLQHFVRT
jgi:hypothetical protein